MNKQSYSLSLSPKQLVGIYLALQTSDFLPDMTFEKTKTQIREILYAELTIDQMEKLEEFYNSMK
ncbi:MAG: hypothetical protein JW904_04565 [Spirochaetales bacterium]|nr:hypothetical protein [Spirochaetales bacterium]